MTEQEREAAVILFDHFRTIYGRKWESKSRKGLYSILARTTSTPMPEIQETVSRFIAYYKAERLGVLDA